MSKFNNWILTKIESILCSKEGCDFISREEQNDESKVIIQDGFGFRYEITVKSLGRSIYWSISDMPQLTKNQLDQIEILGELL
jgi:hypothetical protein